MTAVQPPPPPPPTLLARYRPADLDLLSPAERTHLLAGIDPADLSACHDDQAAWIRVAQAAAWHLLYRKEPDLYERLVAGERLHPSLLEFLPARIGTAVEIGAGTGRLTLDLAARCERLLAVEPSEALRARLQARLAEAGHDHVTVTAGFFEAIPADDDSAELVVACSSFSTMPGHGGQAGLDEMERVCSPGGTVAILWPPRDARFMVARGYTYTSFPGPMAIEFASPQDAAELAAIFYPDAADRIRSDGSSVVSYEVIGVNAPRDLCWKRA